MAAQNEFPPVTKRAVDPEALTRLLGEDRDTLLDILQKFITQADLIFDDIKSACEQRDTKQLAFQAHKLKSSARAVGANHLSDLCLDLETAGKADDWTGVDELVADLQPTIDCVKDYVIGF